jgi:tripartite-type tricarboxylate transporter receptor subunit TctC
VAGYEASQWYGMAAPKKTPVEVVDKLNREINAALSDPMMRAKFADIGGEPLAGSHPQRLRWSARRAAPKQRRKLA